MLSESACQEIRDHLLRSQNPVFYYDNDADGLCSFLLFSRFLGRGKGVAVRSYPDLNASYARKAHELGADAVFILDKPLLDPAFIAALRELTIPIIWIDHHENTNNGLIEDEYFTIYNPLLGKPSSSEPVTYWAQHICNRSEDIWIAVMGCIADHYLPDFASVFAKQHPELWAQNIQKPFDAYYRTEIGNLARALNFGLKDSATHVVALQKYLLMCSAPSVVLADVPENASFRSLYERLSTRYRLLFEKAILCKKDALIFFSYGGATSMSSELSNELAYRSPGCFVAVAYTNAGVTNISLRGNNVKALLERILPSLTSAHGGGHQDAVGARIKSSELDTFYTILREEVTHGRA